MFKFIQENEHPSDNEFPNKIEMHFSSDVPWPNALDGFIQFLRGCGYVFPTEAYPTVLDEEGKDLRESDNFWDTWAEGEEGAVK